MDLNIKGKYALVTGGGRGIGRATALALAEEGCNVAICALEQEEIEKTLEQIKERGVMGIGLVADVTNPANVEKVIKTVVDDWKTIHILINNVGGGGKRVATPVEETSEEVWLETYNINALAAVRFTRKAIPFMKKQKWGRIVTIASLQGREGGGRPWYNMAKSAEISLMKTLAMDKNLSSLGITFNSIAPGAIIFPGNEWDVFRQENPGEFAKVIEAKHPIGRLGAPGEIGAVVAFLCSEKAALINGACLAVDGGESKSF